jgi:hypothetical protein
MEGTKLAILERIAGNLPLPAGALRTGSVPTDKGDVLLAWGRATNQQWYGVWCIDRGWRSMARTCEHGWALSEAEVKQRMLDDAYMIAGMMQTRKLFDESAKFSGKP